MADERALLLLSLLGETVGGHIASFQSWLKGSAPLTLYLYSEGWQFAISIPNIIPLSFFSLSLFFFL